MILQCTLASILYDIYPCLSFLDKFFSHLSFLQTQCAKKSVSNILAMGPVDFAIRLVDSLASLPHRQVKLFGKFKLLKLILLIEKFFGLVQPPDPVYTITPVPWQQLIINYYEDFLSIVVV